MGHTHKRHVAELASVGHGGQHPDVGGISQQRGPIPDDQRWTMRETEPGKLGLLCGRHSGDGERRACDGDGPSPIRQGCRGQRTGMLSAMAEHVANRRILPDQHRGQKVELLRGLQGLHGRNRAGEPQRLRANWLEDHLAIPHGSAGERHGLGPCGLRWKEMDGNPLHVRSGRQHEHPGQTGIRSGRLGCNQRPMGHGEEPSDWSN